MVYKYLRQQSSSFFYTLKQSWFYLFSGLIVYIAFTFNNSSESLWMILSAVAMQLIAANRTTKKSFQDLIVMLIVIVLTAIANYLNHYPLLLSVYVTFITFFSVAIGMRKTRLQSACFIIVLLVVACINVSLKENILIQRCACIAEGFLIIIFLQTIYFLISKKQINQLCVNSLKSLSALNQAFFSCLLAKDYEIKKYSYEKDLHEKKNSFFYEFNKLRELTGFSKMPAYHSIQSNIQQLYETILAIGMVLYRVQDHSTFAVIHKELYALSASINNAFDEVSDGILGIHPDVSADNALVDNVQQLEDVYQSALQIVAVDPNVFLIMIYDLRKLLYSLSELMKISLHINLKSAHE